MLSTSTALLLAVASLGVFAWVALRGARRLGAGDVDVYLTARGSQSRWSVGLSFFASSLGAWILFAPPEFGALGFGVLVVIGYALAQSLAVFLFAFVGPAVRERIGQATTVLEFVRRRFGRLVELYTGGVAVLYMFLFLTAELVGIKGVLGLLGGVDPWLAVVLVAGASALYTAYGGLPASLATDRWQAWLVVGLLAVGGAAMIINVDGPLERARDSGVGALTQPGLESAVILIVAVVAANLFHQGFWQRVWASRDDRELRAGTAMAAVAILPVLFFVGFAGMVAAGGEVPDVPALAFFDLLAGMPAPVIGIVLVLGVTLVASTNDTLQNALTSIQATHVGRRRMSLSTARWTTIALTIPAAVIAVQADSVLRLLLIADLFAATIAVPVLLGLWGRTTPRAALAGGISGLASIIVVGWVTHGTFVDGLRVLTIPGALPSIGAFVAAPLVSGLVTLGMSLLSPSRAAAEHLR